jgi:hypothetical protein
MKRGIVASVVLGIGAVPPPVKLPSMAAVAAAPSWENRAWPR